ncbi:MAG: hypothetical protein SNG14_06660 [Rikenellaceae bacterium]
MEHFTPQHLENDPLLSAPITDEMSDEDLMLGHVSQGDHELYALHCLLCDTVE